MGLIDLLKRIPLDLGQGSVADHTEGKQIAMRLVPPGGPGRTALDVGCRLGVQTRWLQAQGYEVTSIDVEKLFPEAQVVDANQRLPFPDDSFDTAISTWTMCTIPDIEVALAELRRVLAPGGQLHFVEHGLAPDENVQRWQHRLDPLQQRLFGGCHLNRPITQLVTGAGFTLTDVDVFYEKGAPRFLAAESLGVAVSPD